MVEQCGKFSLLDRLLKRLFARKHKVCLPVILGIFLFAIGLLTIFHLFCIQVIIFSQWTKILDIMDYYFGEIGFQVCRIDGSVKLEERKRQVRDWFESEVLILLEII